MKLSGNRFNGFLPQNWNPVRFITLKNLGTSKDIVRCCCGAARRDVVGR